MTVTIMTPADPKKVLLALARIVAETERDHEDESS